MTEITLTIRTDDCGHVEVEQVRHLQPVPTDLAQPDVLIDVGKLGHLTQREREVLRLAAAGLTYQEIAEALCVTERTARTHMFAITSKLEVSSGSMARLFGLFAGIITPGEIVDVWRVHRPEMLAEVCG